MAKKRRRRNPTAEVERAYHRAIKADEAYQAALDKAGESRYSGHHSKPVQRARSRKIKADAAYHKAVDKMRKNPGTTVRGWVKAKAVKIVRNKRGQAVSVKIRT